MANTTNKEFKNGVRLHITEITEHNETGIHEVVREFNHFYKGHRNLANYSNIQDSFVKWASGLPSSLDVEYRTYEVNVLLEKWFNAIGKEYDPKDDFDAFEYYLKLVFRELKALLKLKAIDGGVL